jgi:hypothetical protein
VISGALRKRSAVLVIGLRADLSAAVMLAFSVAISLLSLPIECCIAWRSARLAAALCFGVAKPPLAVMPTTTPRAAAIASEAASSAVSLWRALKRKFAHAGDAASGANTTRSVGLEHGLGARAAGAIYPAGDSGGDSIFGRLLLILLLAGGCSAAPFETGVSPPVSSLSSAIGPLREFSVHAPVTTFGY